MAKKEEKTNVMRVLEQKGIPFTPHTYDHENGAVDGATVARSLGQDPECVFKTLVARGASKAIYVFDIPVEDTLDLKKAARAVGEKSIAMLHQKELLPLTRLRPRGLFPGGHEKAVPHRVSRDGGDSGYHHGLRGQDRLSGGASARRPDRSGGSDHR